MGKRATADEPMFRVWRADEDEDDGRTYGALSIRDAARLYAEYCNNRRDGWEWEWPVVFHVRELPSTKLFAIKVCREMVPDFVPDPEVSFADFAPAVHVLHGETMCDDPRLAAPQKQWPDGHTYVTFNALLSKEFTINAITCERCRKKAHSAIRAREAISAAGKAAG